MGTVQMKEVQHKDIIDMMFGEVKIQSRPKDIQVKDEIVMEVKGLSREKWYKDVNFTSQARRSFGHCRDAWIRPHRIAARDFWR